MRSKSTWFTNPHLQRKASELADKLRAGHETDVKARAKTSCH